MLFRSKKEIHCEIVSYLFTEVVQSNKYYKFCAVGVTSEVGLTIDRNLSVLTVLKKHDIIYSSEIPEVMRYEKL